MSKVIPEIVIASPVKAGVRQSWVTESFVHCPEPIEKRSNDKKKKTCFAMVEKTHLLIPP
jgi:hypothetical protein